MERMTAAPSCFVIQGNSSLQSCMFALYIPHGGNEMNQQSRNCLLTSRLCLLPSGCDDQHIPDFLFASLWHSHNSPNCEGVAQLYVIFMTCWILSIENKNAIKAVEYLFINSTKPSFEVILKKKHDWTAMLSHFTSFKVFNSNSQRRTFIHQVVMTNTKLTFVFHFANLLTYKHR